MKEEIPGHLYRLDNLKGGGETPLPFYMDPELHGGNSLAGPSTQEVARVMIARVKALEAELHWERNAKIIAHLRCVIAEFEFRAVLRKIEKGDFAIEDLPVGDDGHLQFVR